MRTTRVLLCDRRTGFFLQSPDAWTKRAEAAYDFEHIADAMRFAHFWGLSAIELVLAFDQPEYNIRVSVGDSATSR